MNPQYAIGLKIVRKLDDGGPQMRYLALQTQLEHKELLAPGAEGALASQRRGYVEHATIELNEQIPISTAEGFLAHIWRLTINLKDGDRRVVWMRSGRYPDMVKAACEGIARSLGSKVDTWIADELVDTGGVS